MSAHRTPDRVREFAKRAESDGFEVLICAAGGAAHLPGAVAAHTTLPVIGIPLTSSELGSGLDALLCVVQMPPGVPVAGVAIGSWGARNAAYLAAAILALKHEDVRQAYKAFRDTQSSQG
jgi:5-(carboxyamino)imidazole ribonucleotide mutase